MTINPYSPPTAAEELASDRRLFKPGEERLLRIFEFQLDASIPGMRAQRASPRHLVIDGLMVTATLLMVASFTSLWNGTSSLFCVALPLWCFLGIVWLANFTFRRADDFAATCPGLIGTVTGRFSLRQLEIRGPAICMASDVTGDQVRVTRRGIEIKAPGTEQILRIEDRDIIAAVESEDGRLWDDVSSGLLSEDEHDAIIGQRQLLGSDLIGLPSHRRWRNQMMIVAGLTIFVVLLAFLTYLQIPPGMFSYSPRDVVRMPYNNRITATCGLAIGSLLLSGVCIALATKSRRVYGRYNIVVSPSVVSVAKQSQKDRSGLVGEGLRQVRWTDRGLQIVGKQNRLLFLLPSRWFDEDQRSWLADSYGDHWQSVDRDCYFGPRL